MSRKLRDISLKLRTIDEVHIRENTPEIKDNNKKGVIYADQVVEFVEEWEGENHENNNKWYRDKNGDFLWSGGFEGDKVQVISPLKALKYNYNEEFLQIPVQFRKTKGENIKIAVLDSGIQKTHEAFNGQLKDTFNAFNESKEVLDNLNHGTHVCGIIGARNTEAENGIIGIAPKCELYIAKLANEDIVYKNEFKKALKWAIDMKVDIVNMSLSLQDVNVENASKDEELISLLDIAVEQNIVLVAAAGDHYQLLEAYDRSMFYPARYDQCISVGAINSTFYNQNQIKKYSKKIDYICPMEKLYSAFNENGKYGSLEGSSMATAIVSGTIALILSHELSLKFDDLKEILDDIANPIQSSEYSNTTFKIFRK